MLTFLTTYLLLVIIGTITWIRHNLRVARNRDWETDPWGAKDALKLAATALLTSKAWKDHRDGNGLLRTWAGNSTKEQERQARFKERYKYLHPGDPEWSS